MDMRQDWSHYIIVSALTALVFIAVAASIIYHLSPIFLFSSLILGFFILLAIINYQQSRLEFYLNKSELKSQVLGLFLLRQKKSRIAQSQGLHLLIEMESALQVCITRDEVLQTITSYFAEAFPDSLGVIYILQPNEELEMICDWGNQQQGNMQFEPIINQTECWAAKLHNLHITNKKNIELACQHISEHSKDKLHICVPLIAQSDLFGLLHLCLPDNKEYLSSYARLILLSMVHLSSIALLNQGLHDNNIICPLHDRLTGLHSRQYFEDFIEKQVIMANRQHLPVTVIMFELDLFEHFNHLYGIEAGDTMLEALGQMLKNTTRRSDVICRYGGATFMWTLYNCDIIAAEHQAQLLSKRISELTVTFCGELLGGLTVSIGMATFPTDAHTASTLMQNASIALDKAKDTGKNAIIAYASLRKLQEMSP